MADESPPQLRQDLLDDFYAEYDELLGAVREGLTRLESGSKSAEVREGLFRNTHTLKGISAIAGLGAAEKLAHAIEDFFRSLPKRGNRLPAGVIDHLLAAAQRLEQIGIAHRAGRPEPEIRDLLDVLKPAGMIAEPAAPPLKAPEIAAEPTPLDLEADARAKGLEIWLASFSPSPALDARGINVGSVRARLQEIGSILKASPVVKGKSIVFEFLLGAPKGPSNLDVWSSDGVQFSAVATPAEPVPEVANADVLSLTPSHIVRVDLARLDDLMRITGELVILRSRLEDRLQQAGLAGAGLKDVSLGLTRTLREMREAVARVRMVPIGEIFARMPFVVRDLVRGSDKKATVLLEGNQTEVDKYLVERLKEPLLHLVRNAFAHGIESASERVQRGKPAEATITLRARSAGESVIITVRDDGRGIDSESVRARAVSLGLSVPERLDAVALLAVLCSPGFSTREEADRAAGRGVGMAVVANTVRELGGSLVLDSWKGQGTEFTLKLPLTLSIADAIIVGVNGEICAVPQSAVAEIVQVPAATVRMIGSTEVIPYRDGLLPVLRLRTLFKAPAVDAPTITVLVVSTERGATGLAVDLVRGQREIVIRPLADPLVQVQGIAGASELGDGRPILILDPAALTQGVVRPPNNTDSSELTSSTASVS